jgi:hypothetical protein
VLLSVEPLEESAGADGVARSVETQNAYKRGAENYSSISKQTYIVIREASSVTFTSWKARRGKKAMDDGRSKKEEGSLPFPITFTGILILVVLAIIFERSIVNAPAPAVRIFVPLESGSDPFGAGDKVAQFYVDGHSLSMPLASRKSVRTALRKGELAATP